MEKNELIDHVKNTSIPKYLEKNFLTGNLNDNKMKSQISSAINLPKTITKHNILKDDLKNEVQHTFKSQKVLRYKQKKNNFVSLSLPKNELQSFQVEEFTSPTMKHNITTENKDNNFEKKLYPQLNTNTIKVISSIYRIKKPSPKEKLDSILTKHSFYGRNSQKVDINPWSSYSSIKGQSQNNMIDHSRKLEPINNIVVETYAPTIEERLETEVSEQFSQTKNDRLVSIYGSHNRPINAINGMNGTSAMNKFFQRNIKPRNPKTEFEINKSLKGKLIKENNKHHQTSNHK